MTRVGHPEATVKSFTVLLSFLPGELLLLTRDYQITLFAIYARFCVKHHCLTIVAGTFCSEVASYRRLQEYSDVSAVQF